MEDKITLDKDSFKALSVDTRLNMLKLLSEKNHTLSELAESLGNSNSTIKEHLEVLVKAGLIKQKDEGRKWKYYKLTFKGKKVVNPEETKVFFAFVISIISAIGSLFYLFKPLSNSVALGGIERTMPMMKSMVEDVPVMESMQAEPVENMMEMPVSEVIQAPMEHVQTITQDFNILPLIILLISILVLGLTIGYYLKKKFIIINKK